MKTLLPYMFIATVFMTGCEKSEELYDPTTVPEGFDTEIELFIAGNGAWVAGQTKNYDLTSAEEKQIKSLEVLIFNSAQKLVSRTRLDTPASLTNSIKTKSGSSMSIYVVTNTSLDLNASNAPTDVLGMSTTVSALKDIKITNLLSNVAANSTLVMYGVAENVTISSSGSNTISVPLNYVAAKITVNIRKSLINSNDDFQLVDWKLSNLARYSYIFPRSNDAVNPSISSDFVTQLSTNIWSDGFIDVLGVSTPVKTATFYIFENRRGVTSNSDHRLKSGPLAPAKATEMIARGYYRSSSGVVGLDIKLMFGANSTNDYNVERTKQYIYNVNIKSINDIAIDTRFDDANVGFQAEVVNPTLDAHYDFRPLRISAFQGNSVVEVLDANGNSTAGTNFWLKLSSLNITKFVNNSGTYVRPTYNPSTDMTNTLSAAHSSATAMVSNMLYLYADEFLTDGGTRVAQVRITHTPIGQSALTPTTITITQRGIQMAGNVGMRVINSSNQITTENYRLGLELIEEATISITPGNLQNERTGIMQYGFSGSQPVALNSYTLRNGYDNTLNLTLSNITTGALRDPYGRTGTSTISYQDYDPIYNTYAARYCFEKNRDLNGDGVIKGTEIKWYLPSTEEQLLIYTANAAWGPTVADRWTPGYAYNSSSQYSSTLNMAAVFSTGITGTLQSTDAVYVRCVRKVQP